MTDTFEGTALRPEWEWNHNPDTTAFRVDSGLFLKTATVTDDLYAARNTLTRRIPGPAAVGTAQLDTTTLVDGDRAGLSLFRDTSAWIGVAKDDSACTLQYVTGLAMDSSWNTSNKGGVVTSTPIECGLIWLRAIAEVAPGSAQSGTWAYSTDGATFTGFGEEFVFNTDWHYFMGYRFGIFQYGTTSADGELHVISFEVSQP
jgi:beta-xylosidase